MPRWQRVKSGRVLVPIDHTKVLLRKTESGSSQATNLAANIAAKTAANIASGNKAEMCTNASIDLLDRRIARESRIRIPMVTPPWINLTWYALSPKPCIADEHFVLAFSKSLAVGWS